MSLSELAPLLRLSEMPILNESILFQGNLTDGQTNLLNHIWMGREKEVKEMLDNAPALINMRFEAIIQRQKPNPDKAFFQWNLLHLAFYKKHVQIAILLHTMCSELLFTESGDCTVCTCQSGPSDEECSTTPLIMVARNISSQSQTFFSALLQSGTLDRFLVNPDIKRSIFLGMLYVPNLDNFKLVYQRMLTPFVESIQRELEEPPINYPRDLSKCITSYFSFIDFPELAKKLNATFVHKDHPHPFTFLSSARSLANISPKRYAPFIPFLKQEGFVETPQIELPKKEEKKPKKSGCIIL